MADYNIVFKVGDKFEVIKGGMQRTGISGGDFRLKVGEIWDIVGSEFLGPQFRKLNKRGGSTCIINGFMVATLAFKDGRVRWLDPTGPKAVAHDELIRRTGAR